MAERSHHQNPNYHLSRINQPDMKEAPDKRTIRGFSLYAKEFGEDRCRTANKPQAVCTCSLNGETPDKVPQIEGMVPKAKPRRSGYRGFQAWVLVWRGD